MHAEVSVTVRLRPEILDPQGKTIEESLPALGFFGVSGVRVGKSITFMIEGADLASIDATVKRMCEEFLANPVIEDFSYHIKTISEKTDTSMDQPPIARPNSIESSEALAENEDRSIDRSIGGKPE